MNHSEMHPDESSIPTFIGKSSPEDDLWRQTPRSEEPETSAQCLDFRPAIDFLFLYRATEKTANQNAGKHSHEASRAKDSLFSMAC